MKYLIAIIQPSRLEAVKEALSTIEVFRLTVSDVQGIGRQKGHTEVYRGHEYQVNFVRKVKLEIALDDKYLDATVNAISNAARTGQEGKIGDGKIFVLPLEDVIRIRTNERGSDAL
ncbi:MAG TPA: P-II family nitrogen regulator [Chitinispirillaceae bacterium]|jgi:nitrogen regulatory protein P-II 1|nr:P-II family nitrogen regulator [Chitinispirillaceae bacterium]